MSGGAVVGLVLWLGTQNGATYADALAGVATAVAAGFSAVAARQSRDAANESRKALRLHFRPEGHLSLHIDSTAQEGGPSTPRVGSQVQVSPWINASNGGRLRHVHLRWTTSEGVQGRADLEDFQSPVLLPGVLVIDARGYEPVLGLRSMVVTCEDAETSGRWRATITAPPGESGVYAWSGMLSLFFEMD